MISHEKLLHICIYDRQTGIFVWRNPPYHKLKRGKPMGSIKQDGYVQIKIEGVSYYAGPLAWFYVTGKWPEYQIDHKNRMRSDNSFDNLREATVVQNQGNIARKPHNKSGYRGVSQAVGRKELWWRSSLKRHGKTINLGDFRSKEAAAIAYDAGAFLHFGKFAVLNFPNSPQ